MYHLLGSTTCVLVAGELRLKDLMHGLRECLHVDSHLAYHLWTATFPIVWGTMEKSQQVCVCMCCASKALCVSWLTL